MNSHIDTMKAFKSPEKLQLLALGYRAGPDLIVLGVNLLRYGESAWQLYAGADPIMSQWLAMKVERDYKAGHLDFLESFQVDDVERARKDPYRRTRYEFVKEAEEMAPHHLWTLKHMTSLRSPTTGRFIMDYDEAKKRLLEYDRIRLMRIKAEIPINELQMDSDDGQPVLSAMPKTMTMARFPRFPRYLELLYEMHYRTTDPDAPMEWVRKAVALRLLGQRKDDTRFISAGDDIMRYQVWLGNNLDAYFASLYRFYKPAISNRGWKGLARFQKTIQELFNKVDATTYLNSGRTLGFASETGPSAFDSTASSKVDWRDKENF